MAIGINFDKDDEDVSMFSHWKEDIPEEDSTVVGSKWKKKSKKKVHYDNDGEISLFSHWKDDTE